jgi:hypothetical protein
MAGLPDHLPDHYDSGYGTDHETRRATNRRGPLPASPNQSRRLRRRRAHSPASSEEGTGQEKNEHHEWNVKQMALHVEQFESLCNDHAYAPGTEPPHVLKLLQALADLKAFQQKYYAPPP